MAMQRCPRCDQVVARRQPVHLTCAVQRASLPLSLSVLLLLVIVALVVVAVHVL